MADEQPVVEPVAPVPDGQVEAASAPVEPEQVVSAPATANARERHIDRLLSLPLTVCSRLGSTRMTVQDVLNLGQGSIIELNRVAGSSLELVVNGKVVAYGECVIVNDHFGIQLSEIASPENRLKSI
jgi:flagellar motor switch protein FliN/FliY